MNKPSSKRKKAISVASRNLEAPPDSESEDTSLEQNPASATITVTAVEVPELTEEEQRDRESPGKESGTGVF